jgi:hypothetical protein
MKRWIKARKVVKNKRRTVLRNSCPGIYLPGCPSAFFFSVLQKNLHPCLPTKPCVARHAKHTELSFPKTHRLKTDRNSQQNHLSPLPESARRPRSSSPLLPSINGPKCKKGSGSERGALCHELNQSIPRYSAFWSTYYISTYCTSLEVLVQAQNGSSISN